MKGIRIMRKRAGLLQKDLAERIGVAQGIISLWETDKAFPRADKLPQLARILGCTIDELFAEENEKT